MTYSKVLGLSSLAFATLFTVGLVLSPLFVSAQATNTGLLTVYVQVLNPDNASFGPSNFTATVNGQNPTPSTFTGSIQGTLVPLAPGAYNVNVTDNTYGFTSSYSQGCNSTIGAGETQLCVVTMTRYGSYYPNPTVYQTQYYTPQLYCLPQNQTATPGQPTTFVAQGGVGGTYNWFANNRTYANMGPSFTVVIEAPGSSAVTVTNAAQSATCNVQVNGYAGAYGAYPTTPAYPLYPTQIYPTYGNATYNTTYPNYNAQYPTYNNQYPNPTYTNTSYPNPTLTSYVYPRLPNTGFEPSNGAQVAFAVVLLIGAYFATYPYVRKAFALAVR